MYQALTVLVPWLIKRTNTNQEEGAEEVL